MSCNINVGDLVMTRRSCKPGLVVSIDKNIDHNDKLLVSIHEYNGDYAFFDKSDVKKVYRKNYECLSIMANFGEWFYEQHKELYQEILINILIK